MSNRVVAKKWWASKLFVLIVILPTFLSVVYFTIMASDIYISESKFVVRSPDKPATSGLGFILKTAGFSNANEEIYAAQSYVTSRDALRAVNRNGAFQAAYQRPSVSIFDRFNPMGLDGSFESLYKYYGDKVHVENDSSSSISTLSVRAFTGSDAVRINRQLLEMAEATVNRLNTRGRTDLIRYAQAEVDEAKAKAAGAALSLSAYRNQAGVVDPEKQAQVQLQMVSKLQDEYIATETQLDQLRRLAPRNPQIESLTVKLDTLEREIRGQTSRVAGDRRSLSAKAARYQRLFLESQLADKQLAGALSSLEEARNEARRQQIYVERIVQPNQPDSAKEPRRLRGILGTLALGLIAYGVLSMLLAGVREHVD